jgi:hypothetical protein
VCVEQATVPGEECLIRGKAKVTTFRTQVEVYKARYAFTSGFGLRRGVTYSDIMERDEKGTQVPGMLRGGRGCKRD